MADKGGSRKSKDQEMARDLVKRGIYHGYRSRPANQGINWPHLSDVGSAANRRSKQKNN